jgi:RND family efflux transporter MFP subunit
MKLVNFFLNKKVLGAIALIFIGLILFRRQIISYFNPQSPYKTAKVEQQTLIQTISASGKIKSDEEVTLQFQTGGYITWVGVKKGDYVKKGQAIASLDKEQLQKELNQYLIDYMNERWNFDKDRHTYDITTDQLDKYTLEYDIRNLVDKAQFDLDRTVLDVEIANLAIKYATLWTPIDGIVTAADPAQPGVNISSLAPGTYTISNPDKMVFSAKVDEADIGQIKKGQKAKITMDAYPNETLEATVSAVDFTSTTTSSGGTAFEVKFSLPANAQEKYKIGMNGDVEIETKRIDNALVVPIEAVREKDGINFVWLPGKTPTRKNVKVGANNDTYTQILAGLDQNNQVIISDFTTLEKKLP